MRSGKSMRSAMVRLMNICISGVPPGAFDGTASGWNNVAASSSHHYIMSKSTPTLTQSGLLAVLLELQTRKSIRLARRKARFRQMRAAFLSAFRWPHPWRQKPVVRPKLFPRLPELSAR